MSKYIKKDENGFYVFDEIEFSKTLPTGLEYFAVDKETEQIYNLGFNYKEKMEKQIADLEAKLEEKDKEIEDIRNTHIYRFYLNEDKVQDVYMTDVMLKVFNQDKISFAVEQLEKIINLFEPYENKEKDTILCANNGISFLEYIDNQINELKGEK